MRPTKKKEKKRRSTRTRSSFGSEQDKLVYAVMKRHVLLESRKGLPAIDGMVPGHCLEPFILCFHMGMGSAVVFSSSTYMYYMYM